MKKQITYKRTISPSIEITECSTYGEIVQVAQELCKLYGEDALIQFNSGHMNITELVTFDCVREESDKEYSQRLKREAKREERDKVEFERLKKKFGEPE